MAEQSLIFSESLDDVLKVVQETPRGRWFIEAYAQRVKSEGTGSILTAIAKLENHISSIADSGASAEMLQKARSAIATARQEIANLEPKSVTLSNEAQLFANLAEMSRKAFGENQGSKGIERALKLVVELDHDLNGGEATVQNFAAVKPAQQYFRQDETIFEPPQAPKLVIETAPVEKPVETPEIPNRGAKLVIHRMSLAEAIAPAATEAPQLETPVEEPVAIVSTPLPEAKAPVENSRIVIIRRKADEAMAVPLIDVDAEVHAA